LPHLHRQETAFLAKSMTIHNHTREKLFQKIGTYVEDMIDLQISLTAIPALAPENQGNGEAEKADFLRSFLEGHNFPNLMFLHAPDERVPAGYRPNILIHHPGRDKSRTLWILTHTDIVPPGELHLWHRNPYEGYVNDGCVFGRGTEDNQQDLVASIFALKAFIDEDILPEISVGLAFVADEETSSRMGVDYILNHKDNPFRKEDLIVIPDFGSSDGSSIEIAEKSILWLKFTITGLQCHSSRPSLGRNAFLASSHLVMELQKLHNFFPRRDRLFSPPESTFQPTKKEGNTSSINTIPGEDTFYMDCRVLPRYDLKEVMEEIHRRMDVIEKLYGVTVKVSPVQEVQAPPPTPQNAPIVYALKKAIRDVYRLKGKTVGVGAGTVAAVFRKYGYNVAAWSKLGHQAHQPNESCLIENMVGNAKVFAHMMLQKRIPHC